jgi:hypothetical protein
MMVGSELRMNNLTWRMRIEKVNILVYQSIGKTLPKFLLNQN